MANESRPLSIIYNRQSGFHQENSALTDADIIQQFTKHGFDTKTYEIHAYNSMKMLMQEVIGRHQAYPDQGIVVAAGGDGTLNSVAKYLLHQKIAMGIIPLGTFNYVARVLNIPIDIEQAIQVIIQGQNKSVHVAQINEEIYLNNASLGLYPLFIKRREVYNQRFGRFAFHAYSSALDVLIRDRKELKLEIWIDHKKYPVKTPLIFFGNNQLQLADLRMRIAEAAEQGKVAGVVVAKSDKVSLFRILFQLIKGQIDQAKDVYSFSAAHVEIRSKRDTFTVALDGELVEMHTPLHIRVLKNSLMVRVPE